jgi:hypothetical protein
MRPRIAVTQDQLNKLGYGRRDVDPQTLYLSFGTRPVTCADPILGGVNSCGWWDVWFRLPPDLQHPGSWHLDGPPIQASLDEEGPKQPGSIPCGSSSGPFSYGELTIIEINERSIVLKIESVRSFWYGNISGTYTIERCP